MKKSLPYTKTSEAIVGYEDSKLAKREKNDCTVRTFASAFDIDYDKSHEFVAEKLNRKCRGGVYCYNSKLNQISSSGLRLNGKYLKVLGEKDMIGYTMKYDVKVKGKTVKRNMTVGTFSKLYPNGTYILSIRAHTFTIKNGVVIGNPEDAKRLKAVVEQAWQVCSL